MCGDVYVSQVGERGRKGKGMDGGVGKVGER